MSNRISGRLMRQREPVDTGTSLRNRVEVLLDRLKKGGSLSIREANNASSKQAVSHALVHEIVVRERNGGPCQIKLNTSLTATQLERALAAAN